MSSSSNSVRRARDHLASFSKALVTCKSEASTYARCVQAKEKKLVKDACVEEFNIFMNCAKRVTARIRK